MSFPFVMLADIGRARYRLGEVVPPMMTPNHSHCKAVGCYNRIQFMAVCSRCGGPTTPCRGEQDGCK